MNSIEIVDQSVLDRIRAVIADVTHMPIDRIDKKTTRENLEAWDSVAQINVVVAIESEFGMSFSVEEMYSLDGVEKIRSVIERELRGGSREASASRP